MSTEREHITVEVAYALPHQQLIIPIKVASDTTAKEAILSSGILNKFPEIDLDKNDIGIFSIRKSLDTKLRHMDRVEIYRPLLIDPKEKRKQRAADNKALKKGSDNAPAE